MPLYFVDCFQEHYEKKLESARKELVLIPSTPKSTADIARYVYVKTIDYHDS